MTDIQINLVCCTQVILQELAASKITQKDIAVTYAMAIKSAHQKADAPNWQTINEAIVAKWRMSGLERIKKSAWEILKGRVQP